MMMTNTNRLVQRGFALIAATIMLVILIPVMGLAIDTTLLYVDKARLQGAVDGAALAAAQSLSRGNDGTSQKGNAAQAAANFVFLNYSNGLTFTNSITVHSVSPYSPGGSSDITIDESVANQRTITVTAHANIATLFMKWLNFSSTNVVASSTVTRRDVNIAMVVDRSGSLATSGSCGAVQQAAINFVNKFANGRDNMAL